jgi:hypothetical protein
MGKINVPTIEAPQEVIDSVLSESIANITTDDLGLVQTPTEPKNDIDPVHLIPLRMLFGIDVEDMSQDSSLMEILAYAREKGLTKREELTQEIRKIESRLGVGSLFGSRAKQVAIYLKVSREFNESKKKLSALKGNIL